LKLKNIGYITIFKFMYYVEHIISVQNQFTFYTQVSCILWSLVVSKQHVFVVSFEAFMGLIFQAEVF